MSLVSFILTLPGRLRRRTSTGLYRPEIDGLRFWAISTVVVGHMAERAERSAAAPPPAVRVALEALNGPGAGVLLFFAVSGYILTTQFRKVDLPALSPGFLKPYFWRRITRIEPPYVLLLLATYLVLKMGFDPGALRVMEGPPRSLETSMIASLLYSHRWFFGTYPHLFGPGWSLEVEVQFYILAPLLFFTLQRIASYRTRLAVSAIIFLAALAVQPLCGLQVGPVHLWGTLLRSFVYFWVGVMMADLNVGVPGWADRIPRRLGEAVGLASLVAWYLIGLLPAGYTLAGVLQIAALCLCIAGMFFGVLVPGGFRDFCARPWIALIGGACYSLYLTHLQIEQLWSMLVGKVLHGAGGWAPALLANMAGGLVLATVGGLLYYAIIERPFMRAGWVGAAWSGLKRRGARQPVVAEEPKSAAID